MNILHYALGLPPYRSGGLTKYVNDLIQEQSEEGDFVSLIYPGKSTILNINNCSIVKNKDYKKAQVFEIINPTVVPLLYGIKEPDYILNKRNSISLKELEYFYEKTKPEVFHLHTMMGMPVELLKFLKERGVKVLYTSHDYFGICLKTNFIDYQEKLCSSPSSLKCGICNQDSPRQNYLRLRNSKILVKNKKYLSSFVKMENRKISNKKISDIPSDRIMKYDKLLKYYNHLFHLVDMFHFNSAQTKEIFQKFIKVRDSEVISISHAGINDNRKIKIIDQTNIRLGYIGPLSTYKGFFLIKDVLYKLQDNGIKNWTFQVWGCNKVGKDNYCDKISYKGRFNTNDLSRIYNNIDLLIVPSIWKETFSFTTLEALSYGVPVLVSKNVGAKDIVKKYDSAFIISPKSKDFYQKLIEIFDNPDLLLTFNKMIMNSEFGYSFEEHVKMIKILYRNSLS